MSNQFITMFAALFVGLIATPVFAQEATTAPTETTATVVEMPTADAVTAPTEASPAEPQVEDPPLPMAPVEPIPAPPVQAKSHKKRAFIGGGGGFYTGVAMQDFGPLEADFRNEGLEKPNGTMQVWGGQGYGYVTRYFRIGGRGEAAVASVDGLPEAPGRSADLALASGAMMFDAMLPLGPIRLGLGAAFGGGAFVAESYDSDQDSIFRDRQGVPFESSLDDLENRKEAVLAGMIMAPRALLSVSLVPFVALDVVAEYKFMTFLGNANAPSNGLRAWSVVVGPTFGWHPDPIAEPWGEDE